MEEIHVPVKARGRTASGRLERARRAQEVGVQLLFWGDGSGMMVVRVWETQEIGLGWAKEQAPVNLKNRSQSFSQQKNGFLGK